MSASTGQADGIRARAVALVGPYGCGKSTLFEALIAAGGGAGRRAAESRGHTMSTELRLGHASFLGEPWSILDCPGSVEFSFETQGALNAVDIAVVVCEPVAAKAMMVAPLLKAIEDLGLPHILFVNKVDTLAGNVREVLDALQSYSSRPLLLRQVPITEGEAVTGYVDLVSERAYRYRRGQTSEMIPVPAQLTGAEQEARGRILEALADHDDALLEKLLEDVAPTTAEIYQQLRKDLANDAVVEVLLGAADHNHGVHRLWKALRHDAPTAAETAVRHGIATQGEPLAQVFKTVHAGHTGKLSLARIWRGPIRDGISLNGERLGGIYRVPTGGDPVKVAEAQPGDLVALGRLEGAATGVVLGPTEVGASLPFPVPPAPVYALAISTENRKDDVKLSGALQKLVEDDPSLSLVHDQGTGETVLHGQGEMHLNAAVERLSRLYGLKVSTARPQVPFKETIRRSVHQHSRLKRQTGGHGQFADVKLDIEPRARGEGFLFVDKIVGGAVPRQYIPAVGEAAEEATKKGPFGYPVVDVAVTLVDGTFHSVDSSDMAFKSATRMAMSEGLAKADPILLEPIDRVTISVPNSYTARAQRLLTGRRGQILGYAEKPGWPGWDDVDALVPEAEMHDMIIELRSQTMGLGSFVCHFDHLAEARGRVAEQVAIAASR
jgi:elongation factor G